MHHLLLVVADGAVPDDLRPVVADEAEVGRPRGVPELAAEDVGRDAAARAAPAFNGGFGVHARHAVGLVVVLPVVHDVGGEFPDGKAHRRVEDVEHVVEVAYGQVGLLPFRHAVEVGLVGGAALVRVRVDEATAVGAVVDGVDAAQDLVAGLGVGAAHDVGEGLDEEVRMAFLEAKGDLRLVVEVAARLVGIGGAELHAVVALAAAAAVGVGDVEDGDVVLPAPAVEPGFVVVDDPLRELVVRPAALHDPLPAGAGRGTPALAVDEREPVGVLLEFGDGWLDRLAAHRFARPAARERADGVGPVTRGELVLREAFGVLLRALELAFVAAVLEARADERLGLVAPVARGLEARHVFQEGALFAVTAGVEEARAIAVEEVSLTGNQG